VSLGSLAWASVAFRAHGTAAEAASLATRAERVSGASAQRVVAQGEASARVRSARSASLTEFTLWLRLALHVDVDCYRRERARADLVRAALGGLPSLAAVLRGASPGCRRCQASPRRDGPLRHAVCDHFGPSDPRAAHRVDRSPRCPAIRSPSRQSADNRTVAHQRPDVRRDVPCDGRAPLHRCALGAPSAARPR